MLMYRALHQAIRIKINEGMALESRLGIPIIVGMLQHQRDDFAHVLFWYLQSELLDLTRRKWSERGGGHAPTSTLVSTTSLSVHLEFVAGPETSGPGQSPSVGAK